MLKPRTVLHGDLRKAQERIRVLADLAARHLDAEKLKALSVTISCYLTRLSGGALYDQIEAELESERQAGFAPGGEQ